MLSKQRNCLLIHKRSVIYDYTSLKCLPMFQSFVKTAKHIHHPELGTMVYSDFLFFFKTNTLCLLYQARGVTTMCRE